MLCIRASSSLSRFLAPVARGMFYLLVKRLALRAGQRQGGVFRFPPPYLWTPLSPQRVKGCSPLTIPKMRSKPKNASRFAKRIFLCFSHLRLPPMALCLSRTLRPAKARSLLRSSKSAEAQNAVKRSSCECTNLQHFELEPTSLGLLGASSP